MQQAVNDAILTLTIITLSGESKGTFEVREAERPMDLLVHMEFEKGSTGQLLTGDIALISDKTFCEQGVRSGTELTLVVMPVRPGRFFDAGFDPEQVSFEKDAYSVKLFYKGTEVCEKYGSYEYEFVVSSCKCFLHPSPRFNAPLFAANGVPSVDVVKELQEARAKGSIQ
jgi:hypothetical protein